MGLLPQTPNTKKSNNPHNLIIFGLPKAGKTTALSKLKNNLIVDLENGTDYVEGYSIKARSIEDIINIVNALQTEQHNFKFVTIDTVTKLEELALPLAKQIYMDTPMGKNFTGDNVLKLPNGAGHYYLRLAFEQIIGWFESVAENVILVGHVKDKNLTEGGTELNVKTLDLSGKLGSILSAKSDAICYVYRDTETGNLMANFGDMNSVLTGARMQHLAGKTVELAERQLDENGDYQIVTHWERIYPDLQ